MKGAAGLVADEEQLYRRIRESVGPQRCYQIDGGRVVFLHAAFNDPAKSPSVDRAALAQLDPNRTRVASEDGVVTLRAQDVRQRIGPIPKYDEKGKRTKEEYGIDVTSDPLLFGNCAHAIVVITPSNAGGGAFRRLKEGLARLATEAGWTIEPRSPLPQRALNHRVADLIQCLIFRLKGRM